MKIDRTGLLMEVTRNIQIANEVRQDPPVIKAAEQFVDDVATATRSGGALVREVTESWRRHS
jgi:hypothetical protein